MKLNTIQSTWIQKKMNNYLLLAQKKNIIKQIKLIMSASIRLSNTETSQKITTFFPVRTETDYLRDFIPLFFFPCLILLKLSFSYLTSSRNYFFFPLNHIELPISTKDEWILPKGVPWRCRTYVQHE